jgi:hypothetical protein
VNKLAKYIIVKNEKEVIKTFGDELSKESKRAWITKFANRYPEDTVALYEIVLEHEPSRAEKAFEGIGKKITVLKSWDM